MTQFEPQLLQNQKKQDIKDDAVEIKTDQMSYFWKYQNKSIYFQQKDANNLNSRLYKVQLAEDLPKKEVKQLYQIYTKTEEVVFDQNRKALLLNFPQKMVKILLQQVKQGEVKSSEEQPIESPISVKIKTKKIKKQTEEDKKKFKKLHPEEYQNQTISERINSIKYQSIAKISQKESKQNKKEQKQLKDEDLPKHGFIDQFEDCSDHQSYKKQAKNEEPNSANILKHEGQKVQSEENIPLESKNAKLIKESEKIVAKKDGKFISKQRRRLMNWSQQKQLELNRKKFERFLLVRQNKHFFLQIQRQNQLAKQYDFRFGKKIDFQVDEKCNYYEHYKTIRKNEIVKMSNLYCQIYSQYPLPKQKCHFLIRQEKWPKIPVIIGIITPLNFEFTYSKQKQNCICFDAYRSSICVQEVEKKLEIGLKETDTIMVVVQKAAKKVEWVVSGKQIGSSKIPEHMAEQQLYPFIESSTKDTKFFLWQKRPRKRVVDIKI